MFSTITAIGGIVTVATSGIINFLYDKFGINEITAQKVMNDAEVMSRTMRNGSVVGDVINKAIESGSANISYFALYDNNVLQTMLKVLIVASIVGAVINVTPYFFYDLTELKQQGMIKVLKIRAFFEDFGNNTLSDNDLVEVVEMIETANKLEHAEETSVSKAAIRAAKDKEAKKQAKADYKAALVRNTEIKLAPYVVNEMNRFESKLGRIQIADAEMIYAMGLNGLGLVSTAQLKKELRDAKRLPKKTEEEKEIRKYKINFCRTRLTARNYQKKYYGDSTEINVPDDSKLNELFMVEEAYDVKEEALYKELFNAKESGEKQKAKSINHEIKALKEDFKKLNKQINDEQNHRLSYTRSAKPMLDAQKLLKQAENYTHFDELKVRYNEVKNNIPVIG